jgi:hypothetical protein
LEKQGDGEVGEITEHPDEGEPGHTEARKLERGEGSQLHPSARVPQETQQDFCGRAGGHLHR